MTNTASKVRRFRALSYQDGDVVLTITHHPAIAEGAKVVWTWPCGTCGAPVKVSLRTHRMLRTGAVSGVKCAGCLQPPPPVAALVA